MPIKLKVARSARELNGVFWLRHKVYVEEDGKFGGKPLHGERMVDRFDALPNVANIVAYDGDEPVGTLRLNLDCEGGLPCEEHYNFSDYRRQINAEFPGSAVRVCSASMLAIRAQWHNRRDVIKAMFKLATGICSSWQVTHVIATVNHDTASIFERLGFSALADRAWNDVIGNHIVPMGALFERIYQWAFGGLLTSELDRFWIEAFSGHFERQLLAPGERLFTEGEEAAHAYIVDEGWIQVLRKDADGNELTLATLSHGALFGELALIDDCPRSATAVGGTHAELIQLGRDTFLESIRSNPKLVEKLLRVFADRLRMTDQLAMVMAYAPEAGRIHYALKRLRSSAVPDRKNEGVYIAKVGPDLLARAAGVTEHDVRCVLEMEKQAGHLDYGASVIRFLHHEDA